ncbi:hypothetical protein H072_5556 [Dactylellina haptotyla CBS 200.50]|uniref:Uncharacterized protein n=1 Tax=Dactylellina haptotyla (strain CBS 200.50) TaxID=1284197 RepID=S8ACA8_DACHA|nr:hypothetical protein H072_5556 [Dactylellina haptotyla CBS 200.50]
MARQLQSRLAVASFKTQRGWENLDLDTIEPRVDQDLMQKRMQAIQEGKTISPLQTYTDSDNNSIRGIRRRPSNGSSHSSSHRKKRARTAAPVYDHTGQHIIHGQDQDIDMMLYDPPNPMARHSFRNHNKNRAWKETHRLPQSSPGYHHSSFDMSHPQFSFANSPTREVSPTLLSQSHSRQGGGHFDHHQPVFHSSPPRTPPHRTIPARPVFTTAGEKVEDRNRNGVAAGGKQGDGEGADLLLYLATSPSPNTMTKANVSVAPSTPPSKSSAAALPSSMMNTPGGGVGGGGSGSFNFHDFVHITPSPAQGMWGNGGSGRTPSMMTTARRRLNFDGLVPPSPMNGSQGSQGSQGKVTGLGMELGGELVSPTSGL